ncbi:MAG TPA: hypothetical protein PL110_01650 [Candidatus Eremiobacteraeota bacterium]|nr:MAG: hypothetical protein BWY64_00050 [bacterium ADurb.Bin363]HPZ06793.1 hypothetical protein [Candidatus Eremiobacteraeota bacterium]
MFRILLFIILIFITGCEENDLTRDNSALFQLPPKDSYLSEHMPGESVINYRSDTKAEEIVKSMGGSLIFFPLIVYFLFHFFSQMARVELKDFFIIHYTFAEF